MWRKDQVPNTTRNSQNTRQAGTDRQCIPNVAQSRHREGELSTAKNTTSRFAPNTIILETRRDVRRALGEPHAAGRFVKLHWLLQIAVMPYFNYPDVGSSRGLSQRVEWAGGETIASVLMARTLDQPELVSLAAGFAGHETLPIDPARKALEAVRSQPERARSGLQYGTTIGYLPLRDAMLRACDELLAPIAGIEWMQPAGGLYVWSRLPDQIDTGLDGPLFDRAVAEGALYVPGAYCFPAFGRPSRANMLRLRFGIQSCESIHRGIAAIARAVRYVM